MEDLKKRINSLSDEELMKIIEDEHCDYREEALGCDYTINWYTPFTDLSWWLSIKN